MATKKKRRRKTEVKYLLRRMFLLLLSLGVVGGAVYLVWNLMPGDGPEEPDQPGAGVAQGDGEEESGAGDAAITPALATGEGLEMDLAAAPGDAGQEEQQEQLETEEEEAPPAANPADDWMLLLVNYASPLPDSYVDSLELELMTDPYRVDARIADPLKRMFAKAKEDGVSLMLCSAFRSVEKQAELYEGRKAENLKKGLSEDAAVEATLAYTAAPGTSEHHTGLAVDIVTPAYQSLNDGFADTLAFQWLDQNAADFGFILRYPREKEAITKISYEPWHYRYVGVEHAKRIKETGYCLEEYLHMLDRTDTLEVRAGGTDDLEDTTEEG